MILLLETFPAQSGDVSSGTRVSSGGVTGSNESRVFGDHKFNLSTLDRSMMVSTGSQSSPSTHLSVFSVESKSVLGLNLQNISPTQFDFSKRILNDDSVISNCQTRSMNNEINESAKNCGNNDCKCNVLEVGSPERLQDGTSQKGVSNKSDDNRRSRSKEFGITHPITVLAIEDLHG